MNLTVEPRFFWAHCTPSQADWLKLLSSTLPTSVTRPTLSFLAPATTWFGQPESAAAAATGLAAATAGLAAAAGAVVGFAAGAVVAAAAGGDVGAGAAGWQAASTR